MKQIRIFLLVAVFAVAAYGRDCNDIVPSDGYALGKEKKMGEGKAEGDALGKEKQEDKGKAEGYALGKEKKMGEGKAEGDALGKGKQEGKGKAEGVALWKEWMRGDTVRLEEVNVVAVKQHSRLYDEPGAVSVIGQDALEQLNAVAIKGISDMVPNLYIPDYGSRITSTIYVRGIGARMDQPAVGLNVDNVPYLNKNSYDFDLADIASVEMMRGPQSTLYGRNTMGGLINITTLSPMRWQGVRVMAEGARGNHYRASLGWYGKQSERFANAVTGSFSYLGGFFTNQYNKSKIDKEMMGALRWKMNLRVNDRLYLQNVVGASVLRQGGYPYELVGSGVVNYNDTCFYRRTVVNDGLTLNYRGDKFTVSSITSLQYLDDNMTLDQDFLPLSYFTLTQKQKDFGITEDILFKSKGEGRYKWLAGVFGFYRHLDMEAPVTFKDTGIAELIESHRNSANPSFPIAWDTREFPLNSDFTIPTYSIALYHESRYEIGRWDFEAGLRLDYENSTLNYRSRCLTGYEIYHRNDAGVLNPYTHIDIDIDESGKLSRHYFTWMPRLSVMYELPGDFGNVYGSVSKGYKSGGFNTQMFSEVLQQRLMYIMGIGKEYDINDIVGYKPEYSWNYEVGGHFSKAGWGLEGDVSLFYIDCRDQQLTMFPSGTTTGRIMANAGKTRSMGAEVTVRYNPTWLQGLNFTAAYGFTDARFVKFNNGLADYAGKRVPYVPGNTLFVQGLYTLDLSGTWLDRMIFDVNVKGTGNIYWNEGNTQVQKFHALLGASVTAEWKNLSLQVWGKNLTDTKFHTFYFMSMGNEFLQRGRPWQVGATLRWDLEF